VKYFTDQRQSPRCISVAIWGLGPAPLSKIPYWVVMARELARTIVEAKYSAVCKSAWLGGRTRACQPWFPDFRHRLRLHSNDLLNQRKENTMRLINFRPTLILTAIALMGGAVMFPATAATSVAAAGADDRGGCRKVRARLMSMSVIEGCTSPFWCFAGSISGSGLLNGTHTAVAFDFAPSAGLPVLEPVTTL
jgi:hypothetical protein